MNVTVVLDELVAADVLALLTAVAEWGDEWVPIAGRSSEAIPALREVIRYEVAADATHRLGYGADEVAASQ